MMLELWDRVEYEFDMIFLNKGRSSLGLQGIYRLRGSFKAHNGSLCLRSIITLCLCQTSMIASFVDTDLRLACRRNCKANAEN